MKRIFTAAVVALLLASSVNFLPARAQDGPNFGPGPRMGGPGMRANGRIHWHGRVDQTVILYIHGWNINARVTRGHGVWDQGSRFDQRLPQVPVHVFVRSYQGRGQVQVIQQPNGRNGFTAAVRINDWQPGSGFYQVNIGWR